MQPRNAASFGRHGDSTLLHVQPSELAGLSALTGLPITRNPATGYPEMFSWKKLLTGIGLLAAPFTGGLSALGALAPIAAPIMGGAAVANLVGAVRDKKKPEESGSEASRALDKRNAQRSIAPIFTEPLRVDSYGTRPSLTGEEQVYYVAPAGLGALNQSPPRYASGGMLEPEEAKARDVVVQYLASLRGQHSNPDQAESAFIEYYGPDAAQDLRSGGMVKGPGAGMDDAVTADLHGQKALLSNDEFVLPADVVSALGDGSSEAGARKLHAMMSRIRKEKTGSVKQPQKISNKVLPR